MLNPLATGVFFGISPTTTRARMIRAIIEGCVFNCYESYRHIEDLGIDYKEIIFVGGPSNSPVWCQALADTTNRKVITVSSSEPSTFGDAITAGCGCRGVRRFRGDREEDGEAEEAVPAG